MKKRQLEEAKPVIELGRKLIVIAVLIIALLIIAALAAMLARCREFLRANTDRAIKITAGTV